MNSFKIDGSTSTLKPGVLYIFNHEKFDENLKLEERKGTKDDAVSLYKTFAKYGVKTVYCSDYTLANIDLKIEEISKTNYSENSCIVVVFLTHGFQNNVIAAKDTFYCFKDKILKIQSNKTLESKTKLFLIQACRIGIPDILYSEYAMITANQLENSKIKPENLNETIVMHSSSEFLASYRSESKGTPFIQKFCFCLENFGSKLSIREIIDLVIASVPNVGVNQLPEITRNTNASYIFGNYVAAQSLESSSTLNAGTEKIGQQQQQKINKLTKSNDNEIHSNIKDLSELELSDDEHLVEPITNINDNVTEFMGYSQKNNQPIFSPKRVFQPEVDQWIQICSNDRHTPLLSNLVRGGTDIGGYPLYIGRGIFKNELLPAKVKIEEKCAFVSYNCKEHRLTEFAVLVGTDYRWAPGARGSLPQNAVRGGMTCDGEILYIGRTAYMTTITPGKIHPSKGYLYISFDGKEIFFDQYEVLVKS